MTKKKTKFMCQECGYETPKWMGRCPSCTNWNTLVEETFSKQRSTGVNRPISQEQAPISILKVEGGDEPRYLTEMGEFNRVLGGGIVHGSLVLVGGDPGIGKSTLLLQISAELAKQSLKVLYVSGEESAMQTKLRADRLGVKEENVFLLCETNLDWIE